MVSKRPKSIGSSGSVKANEKSKDKKQDSVSPIGSSTEPGLPDDIFPLVLTSATQELFECIADEDVTQDNPYKLLKKDQILQDLKTRAAVSDFHPVKQIVLNYPGDELLLVFDRDFTYGQSFYLVGTEELKEKLINPPQSTESDTQEEESSESFVYRTPESQPWVSLGSELEIEEESVTDSRQRLKYKISRVRREFGGPVTFTDRNALDSKDGYVECSPYEDKRFSIMKMETNAGIQAAPNVQSTCTQTHWSYPQNMCTQYESREFTEDEKEDRLNSESLLNFLNSVVSRFEIALQQNEIMDVFLNDWQALGEEEGTFEEKAGNHLEVYQSFTDLHFSKAKSISDINWHPAVNGVIAVALTEKASFEERINSSIKLLLNPPLILFWSFSDPINPQLMLECPDDVFSFQFCPSNPNIIVGGCMNGQIILWDISVHEERLQGARSGTGKGTSANTNSSTPQSGFEDKRENTPVVRYCAVSSIENGHKAPVTDVQWLPESFEVSKTGVPVENKNQTCVQIVTCAPDCLMFWDVRAPKTTSQSLLERKHKTEENLHQNQRGVPSAFKHLDLSWKPFIKVMLPKIDSSGLYSPLKFSLRDISHIYLHENSEKSQTVERLKNGTDYAQLRVSSAKQLKPLEDISTKFYIGTDDGEIVYTDWKLEKDDSGKLFSAKPSHCFVIHNGVVNTVRRSPFFKDIVLTVGGWTFAIWKEGVMNGPIIHSSCSAKKRTVGYWSLSRPGVFFIGKEDGNLEVWDLMEKTHEPFHTLSVSTSQITCIKPWIVSSKKHFLAVSDHYGTLHILDIPWALRSPSSNEESCMRKYFENEVEWLICVGQRWEMRAKQRREMEVDDQKKKVEPVVPEKVEEQIEEENRTEYEAYLAMETLYLKNMGLLSEGENKP